jgi:hypothetical protein
VNYETSVAPQIRALTDTKGRACSVKPCLDMRHALGLLDFEDESIDGELACNGASTSGS